MLNSFRTSRAFALVLVLTAPSVHGTLLSQFTTGDQVAVFLESCHHSEWPIVLVSCCLACKEVTPSDLALWISADGGIMALLWVVMPMCITLVGAALM